MDPPPIEDAKKGTKRARDASADVENRNDVNVPKHKVWAFTRSVMKGPLRNEQWDIDSFDPDTVDADWVMAIGEVFELIDNAPIFAVEGNVNKAKRLAAHRTFSLVFGLRNREPLPDYFTNKIRATCPSSGYVGFKEA